MFAPAEIVAQTTPPPPSGSRPGDPADANAATTTLVHRSALSGYKRLDADTPAPTAWREANVTVERIGGWRSYAREANAPASEPAAPPKGAGPAGSAPTADAPPRAQRPATPSHEHRR